MGSPPTDCIGGISNPRAANSTRHLSRSSTAITTSPRPARFLSATIYSEPVVVACQTASPSLGTPSGGRPKNCSYHARADAKFVTGTPTNTCAITEGLLGLRVSQPRADEPEAISLDHDRMCKVAGVP